MNALGQDVMDYVGDVGLGEILASGAEGDILCKQGKGRGARGKNRAHGRQSNTLQR